MGVVHRLIFFKSTNIIFSTDGHICKEPVANQ
jgi:hypothetical protein